ncbi:hypothetical protein, partial [Streptomyces sp. NPDC054838]
PSGRTSYPAPAAPRAAASAGGGSGACTATSTTVPHEPHPTSGCGHSLSLPQAPHRTVTQLSLQVRWVSGSGGAARSSGGVIGLPQAHG